MFKKNVLLLNSENICKDKQTLCQGLLMYTSVKLITVKKNQVKLLQFKTKNLENLLQ